MEPVTRDCERAGHLIGQGGDYSVAHLLAWDRQDTPVNEANVNTGVTGHCTFRLRIGPSDLVVVVSQRTECVGTAIRILRYLQWDVAIFLHAVRMLSGKVVIFLQLRPHRRRDECEQPRHLLKDFDNEQQQT